MAEGQGQRHGWQPARDTPRRWPLVNVLQNRNPNIPLTKDARIINAYAEFDQEDGEYWIYKRPGLGFAIALGLGAGSGIYTETGTNTIFAVSGNTVYSVTTTNGVNILSAVVGSVSNGPFFFETVGTGVVPNNRYVVMANGVQGYYATLHTHLGLNFWSLSQITDSAFPINTAVGWAYLDGYLYIMDTSGNIYNTANVNNPAVWTGGGIIPASSNSDLGIALTKQLNYIVAFKQYTTQVFYDAGNPPPGSPLSVVPDAQMPLGCLAGTSVQSIDNTLLWLTSNQTISPQVVQMDNLTPQIVSTPAVERILDNVSWTGINPNTQVRSWVLKHGGHRFYVLSLILNNLTLVYDIDQKLWYSWTDSSGNFWPIVGTAFLSPGLGVGGLHIAQHNSNGNLYFLDGDYEFPNDAGTLFPVDIYTPNYDAGVDRRKLLNAMRFNADQTNGSVLNVRYSDDDYQSWSNFRNVDLSVNRPRMTNNGTFRRRAYHLRHNCNTAFRIKTVDLQMELGTL